MQTYGPSQFFKNALGGGIACVIGFLCLFAYQRITRSDPVKTPEWQQYERSVQASNAWEESHRAELRRQAIEEIIAGRRNPTVDDTDAVAVACASALHALGNSSEPIEKRLRVALRLARGEANGYGCFATPHGTEGRIYYTQNNDFRYLVDEPERLIRMANGDQSAIHNITDQRPTVLPRPTGAEFISIPTKTPWPWWTRWLASCLLFAGGYLLSHSFQHKNNTDPHPFHSMPKFLFGWLVMMAFAPGFLLFHFLRALFLDTDNLVRGWKMTQELGSEFWKVVRASVTTNVTDKQAARITVKLAEFRELAVQMNDTKLVERIDKLSALLVEERRRDRVEMVRIFIEDQQTALASRNDTDAILRNSGEDELSQRIASLPQPTSE